MHFNCWGAWPYILHTYSRAVITRRVRLHFRMFLTHIPGICPPAFRQCCVAWAQPQTEVNAFTPSPLPSSPMHSVISCSDVLRNGFFFFCLHQEFGHVKIKWVQSNNQTRRNPKTSWLSMWVIWLEEVSDSGIRNEFSSTSWMNGWRTEQVSQRARKHGQNNLLEIRMSECEPYKWGPYATAVIKYLFILYCAACLL